VRGIQMDFVPTNDANAIDATSTVEFKNNRGETIKQGFRYYIVFHEATKEIEIEMQVVSRKEANVLTT